MTDGTQAAAGSSCQRVGKNGGQGIGRSSREHGAAGGADGNASQLAKAVNGLCDGWARCPALTRFAALPYFAPDGTEHATHLQQGGMIRRYVIWRNNHA